MKSGNYFNNKTQLKKDKDFKVTTSLSYSLAEAQRRIYEIKERKKYNNLKK